MTFKLLLVGSFLLVSVGAFSEEDVISVEYKNQQKMVENDLGKVDGFFNSYLSSGIKDSVSAVAKEQTKNKKEMEKQSKELEKSLKNAKGRVRNLARALNFIQKNDRALAQAILNGGFISQNKTSVKELADVCATYNISDLPNVAPEVQIKGRYEKAINDLQEPSNVLWNASVARYHINKEKEEYLKEAQKATSEGINRGESEDLQRDWDTQVQVWKSQRSVYDAQQDLKKLEDFAVRDYNAVLNNADTKQADLAIKNGKLQAACKQLIQNRVKAAEDLNTPVDLDVSGKKQ